MLNVLAALKRNLFYEMLGSRSQEYVWSYVRLPRMAKILCIRDNCQFRGPVLKFLGLMTLIIIRHPHGLPMPCHTIAWGAIKLPDGNTRRNKQNITIMWGWCHNCHWCEHINTYHQKYCLLRTIQKTSACMAIVRSGHSAWMVWVSG